VIGFFSRQAVRIRAGNRGQATTLFLVVASTLLVVVFASIRLHHVAVARVTYTMSPRAYVSGLLQYNSGIDVVSGNFRLRWEWAPGSELFLVYTEDRDTDVTGRSSQLQTRGFVIKINRTLRI